MISQVSRSLDSLEVFQIVVFRSMWDRINVECIGLENFPQ